MADDLANTGKGNLFVIFVEPVRFPARARIAIEPGREARRGAPAIEALDGAREPCRAGA